MGEDMHFRMYLKRKKDGKYVNAHEVCEWNPDGTVFSEPFSGRCYDVFSLFGSGRGNYPPLPSVKYGLPDFLVGSDLDEYCRTCGFYGFAWFYADELEKSLADFVRRLDRPLEFLYEDDPEREEWSELMSPGVKTADQMKLLAEKYAEWRDEHGTMMNLASELHLRVKRFIDLAAERDGLYKETFDMARAVFLFFFDS